jgi:hypothetical protein
VTTPNGVADEYIFSILGNWFKIDCEFIKFLKF